MLLTFPFYAVFVSTGSAMVDHSTRHRRTVAWEYPKVREAKCEVATKSAQHRTVSIFGRGPEVAGVFKLPRPIFAAEHLGLQQGVNVTLQHSQREARQEHK